MDCVVIKSCYKRTIFDYIVSLWWYIAIVSNPPCDLSIFCASKTLFGTSKMHLSPQVALNAVRSKVVVLLLLIRCWLLLPFWDSVIVLCFVVLYFVSILYSFAIILMGKRELIALLSLSSWCLVIVVWLFLLMPQVCLQFMIVVFPDHTHILLFTKNYMKMTMK